MRQISSLCAQAGLAEALKDLDAGTDAVAAEHRQCQKSASCLPPPAGTAPTDGRPGLDSASTDGTTTAVNEPSQRAAAQVSDAAMTPAAQAVTAPEVPGPTRPRRLDLLTVSAEAPELVQHPLIAAEEVCTCPWSVARRSAPCRGLVGYQDLLGEDSVRHAALVTRCIEPARCAAY